MENPRHSYVLLPSGEAPDRNVQTEVHEPLRASDPRQSEITSDRPREPPIHGPEQTNSEEANLSQLESKPEPNFAPRRKVTRGTWLRLKSVIQVVWLWESISILVSIGALIAAIVLVSKYEDRPSNDWPYQIGLNAVLSILATVIRASIALPLAESISQLKWTWFQRDRSLKDMSDFDAASRGPWGATLFLFSSHSWSLATFASALVVISLAVGPFLQQVVDQQLQNVTTSPASIPICGTSGYSDVEDHTTQNYQNSVVTLPSQGAIYNGILGAGSSRLIEPTCSTGNCTFDTYQNLGFCSRCENITDRIIYELGKSTVLGNGSDTMEWTLTPHCNEDQNCRMRLPNNISLSLVGTIMNATAWRGTSLIGDEDPYNDPILSFSALINGEYTNMAKQPTAAIECSLSFCVQTINATLESGSFLESITPTPANLSYTGGMSIDGGVWDYPYSTVSLTPEICYRNGTQKKPPYGPNDDCIFNFTSYNGIVLQNSLVRTLTGTAAALMTFRMEYTSPLIQGVFGDGTIGSINKTFTTLAREMTNHARSDPVICNSTRVFGTATTTKNMIRVRWLWMVLPVFAVFATTVFFVFAVLANWSEDVWKSSPLPLLLFGLDQEIRDALAVGTGSKLVEIEDSIKGVKVHYDRARGLMMTRTNDC